MGRNQEKPYGTSVVTQPGVAEASTWCPCGRQESRNWTMGENGALWGGNSNFKGLIYVGIEGRPWDWSRMNQKGHKGPRWLAWARQGAQRSQVIILSKTKGTEVLLDQAEQDKGHRGPTWSARARQGTQRSYLVNLSKGQLMQGCKTTALQPLLQVPRTMTRKFECRNNMIWL